MSTSDRRSEPLAMSSRPTFVVTRAQIEAQGARTVAAAIAGVPGVALFPYGGFGSALSYGIRGASTAQTLVLVDGIPLEDPAFASSPINQLSTIGVERIEVVESGSSTLYGSSAVGGVINVITRVPRGAYLALSDGSLGERDLRASAGDGHLGFALERHVATNDYAYPATNYGSSCVGGFIAPCSFPGGVRTNAFGDESAGILTFDQPLDPRTRVRGHASLFETTAGVPGELTFLSPDASQRDADRDGQIELERQVGVQRLSLTAAGFAQREAYVAPLSGGGEDDVYIGRTQLSLKDALSAGRADAVFGIDLTRASGAFGFPAAPQPSGTPIPAYGLGAAQSQSAAYAQLGYAPLAGTRITAGLRAEHDTPGGKVLAPSFGGIVRAGAFSLAGNLGESFRAPTLDDLYFPGFSNPALVPEKVATADATLGYESGATALSLGWFARSGANFIVLDPVTFVPFNASSAATAGIALTASAHPLPGIVAQIGLTNLYRAIDYSSGARLPRNPVLQTNLSLSHPLGTGRFGWDLRWRIVGSDGDDAANVAPPPALVDDAYDALDGDLRYRLAPGAILSLRGFNLGDERYSPIFGYPAPGRRLELELATP
ncbi:MAG: TonB-dependent receptor [Vulcanimicrobiaceae bacterium]